MDISTPKICIIIAYFGKFPTYFPMWLKSCIWNKSIDFLICTDNERPAKCTTPNIHWEKKSFSEFVNLVKSKLNVQIALDSPYKCCDFKAVYGNIFDDFLTGYDYWGYCDMDLILGDLRNWFNKLNLTQYDKFLNRGHLTLIRNTPENNGRYKLPCTPGKSYKDVFSNPNYCGFDEVETNYIYLSYGFPFFNEYIAADISPFYERLRLSGFHKDYHHQLFFWQNGKVWRVHSKWITLKSYKHLVYEEFPYIHFQKRKMDVPSEDVINSNAFYICPHKFEEKTNISYPTSKDFREKNPYRGKVYEFYELAKEWKKRYGIKTSLKMLCAIIFDR